jgi:3-hydroxyanthranilate 3,4-dioxygenase
MLKFDVLELKKWIDENRHLLKPPVGNQQVWKNTKDFIIMVVGGPNSRTDYHYNESEEFFFQLEGDIKLGLQTDGKATEVEIKEGEIFLLPGKIPHSPQRGANTIGLVIERVRRPEDTDGLLWFCKSCNHLLYEEYFHLTNIVSQMQPVFKRFYESEELRTCHQCGTIMEVPASAK